MSQQFAVNEILGDFRNQAGVFSVNGPPGTGKTTMLRDVLAGLVVERARVLADLDNAHDAFTDVLEEVQLGPHKGTVRGVRPALTGFEVVLATATNDAAANVTAEIPGIKAVDGAAEDAEAADYFRGLASHILKGDAWGLIAAVLGSMKNRRAFAERFWWANDIGMRAVLRRVCQGQESVVDWREATSRFRQADRKVTELMAVRQRVADAIQELRRMRPVMVRLEGELTNARTACAQHAANVAWLTSRRHQAHHWFVAQDWEYENHLRHKPGFWVSIATWFTAPKEWARRHRELAWQRDQARSAFDHACAEEGRAQAGLAEAERWVHHHEQALAQANASAAAAQKQVADGHARWPGHVPPDDLTDEQAFQLWSPWADKEICAARTSLFLEALRLHKAFLFNAASSARGNLSVITEMLKRGIGVKPETLRAAWQTLFLVIPMISTTFSSLPRLFNGLGREALGWLLVDEAGQAAPQELTGGLWRCRRAVVVGDPQQLEPIVTLPLPAQHALRRHHDVDEEWTPDGTSAQRVADRLAHYGTSLPEPDGEHHVWVGAPLRVHRRCDRPMFDISNRIAYGGDLMIYGTAERDAFHGANVWIDVRSSVSDGNWVDEEGNALRTLLRELISAKVPTKEVRVISPFRAVVSECEAIADTEINRTFADKNVGTVHTVQGQEADVIVLVLGTGPEGSGARGWAAEKPNLLNVAVSRAKRRLYVIGNQESWQSLRYFDVLARTLPVRSHAS